MKRMKFSLVTTCRNEIASVHRWKKNILEQTRQPDEIVIVDAYSDDGTAEILFEWAARDQRVKVYQEKGAAAHGRNFAIGKASYDILLSTDMGVRLAKEWCEALITPFEIDPEVEVVAGNTCIDRDTVRSLAARVEYYIENGGMSKLGPGFVPGNRSVSYKRHVWKELGGLPEDLTFYADDSVFGRQILQAGYKTAYAPDAMTYWARPQRFKHFFKEVYNYGYGDGEALLKMSYSVKMYRKKIIPRILVAPLNGLRVMQKQSKIIAFKRALKNKDILACIMIPIFSFGRGWNFAKGYLKGIKNGDVQCHNCRKRLANI